MSLPADEKKSWHILIDDADKLVTLPEAVVAGFAEQAQVKVEKAFPFTERANELRLALEKVEDINKLMDVSILRNELVAAAGISQKARRYFTDEQLRLNVEQVFQRIYDRCVTEYTNQGIEAARAAFRAEIVSRFLLTAGATLDGQMRNWTGATAQAKVVEALYAALGRKGIRPQYEEEPIETAVQAGTLTNDAPTDTLLEEAEPELQVSRLHWLGRLLLFNIKPTMLLDDGQEVRLYNIDMVLLTTEPPVSEENLKQDPKRYLACGELKGGIDPAGADEHWKTATTALDRIRMAFVSCPALFFIGAAIVSSDSKKRRTKRTRSMAHEIFERLQDGKLTYAANLTNGPQLEALADWLVSI